MWILRPGLLQLVKEMMYTAVAAVILFTAYLSVRAWTQRPREDASIESARREIASRPVMMAGKRLTVRGAEIGQHAYSLLVVTSPACPFCINSAAFHRRLVKEARSCGIPLWIAVPASDAAERFLSSSDLRGASVVTWRDLSRRFQGVPSVVLVDSSGLIRRIWVGQLRTDEEEGLLDAIHDPSRVTLPLRRLAGGELMLTEADWRTLSAEVRTTVISIEERGHFGQEHPAGAINIPLAELGMRAERDLRKDRLNVIDCSPIADAVCSAAVEHLRKLGFQAAAVDFGRPGRSE